MQARRSLVSILFLFALPVSAPAFADVSEKEYCWRDTHTRGVGRIPAGCAPGRERIGLLCYTECPAGMTRKGFDCHSVCPEGMRDDGLFCRRSEYGRGVGHTKKACRRNNNDDPNACERYAGLWYPKCREGYRNVGCCICRPHKPDCEAKGLGPRLDLSCAKKLKLGDPVTGVCRAGEEKQGGLCYKPCREGYSGVGPVCWGKAPEGWVLCGMGAAKDKKTCTSKVATMITSVGSLALSIVTLGTSGGATNVAKAKNASKRLTKLKHMLASLKALYEKAKPALKLISTIKKAGGVAQKIQGWSDEKPTAEDIVRISAEIASIVALADPTGLTSGVADTVAAYTYPKCSKYFPGQGLDSGAKPAPAAK